MHLRHRRAGRDGHRRHRGDRGNHRQPRHRRHRLRRRGSYHHRRRHRDDRPDLRDEGHRRDAGRDAVHRDRLRSPDGAACCRATDGGRHRDAGPGGAAAAGSAGRPAAASRTGCCRHAACAGPAWGPGRAGDRVWHRASGAGRAWRQGRAPRVRSGPPRRRVHSARQAAERPAWAPKASRVPRGSPLRPGPRAWPEQPGAAGRPAWAPRASRRSPGWVPERRAWGPRAPTRRYRPGHGASHRSWWRLTWHRTFRAADARRGPPRWRTPI